MKLRVRFSKFGPIKFIGHLDTMRFVQKAIKAAGIPVKYTEGFSPHQVLSFAFPLGVGMESESEYFDIEVVSMEGSETFKESLNREMCEGLTVLDIYELPEKTKGAMASVSAASYRIRFHEESPAEILEEAVLKFRDAEEVKSYKETKTGIKERNLKDAVYEIKAEDRELYFTCDASSGGNLKPSALLEGLFTPYGIVLNAWDYDLIRTEVYKTEEEKYVPLYEGLKRVQ